MVNNEEDVQVPRRASCAVCRTWQSVSRRQSPKRCPKEWNGLNEELGDSKKELFSPTVGVLLIA